VYSEAVGIARLQGCPGSRPLFVSAHTLDHARPPSTSHFDDGRQPGFLPEWSQSVSTMYEIHKLLIGCHKAYLQTQTRKGETANLGGYEIEQIMDLWDSTRKKGLPIFG